MCNFLHSLKHLYCSRLGGGKSYVQDFFHTFGHAQLTQVTKEMVRDIRPGLAVEVCSFKKIIFLWMVPFILPKSLVV